MSYWRKLVHTVLVNHLADKVSQEKCAVYLTSRHDNNSVDLAVNCKEKQIQQEDNNLSCSGYLHSNVVY